MFTAPSRANPRASAGRDRPRRRRASCLVAIAAAAGVAASAAPALGATFTVTNTNDGITDVGSLRWAIDQANTVNGRDTIAFGIPGAGPHVIAPATDLPTILGRVLIDGYSQLGAAVATSEAPADLRIVSDATATTRGLELATDNSTLRGLVVENAAADGVLSDGIRVQGRGNLITGNYVGTDESGTQAAGNLGNGMRINGVANRVGGPAPEEGNLISGNNLDGVRLETGSGNTIQGNVIGPDVTASVDLDVNQDGIQVERGSVANVIGGAADGEGNVISGGGDGVQLDGDLNTVQGNTIGTNAAGDAALSNSSGGVSVTGTDNLIGGPGAGAGNLISGNAYTGISISSLFVDTPHPPVGNRIEGNLIGTDVAGTRALPNGSDGVLISDASANTIGGVEPGAANVIAGNDGDGVKVQRLQASSPPDMNEILGNTIGTDVTGTLDLGNGQSGVRIDGAMDTAVGDSTGDGANTIAHNALDGVTVTDATGNAILRNSIHSNGDLGIDLDDDGVTANDPALNLDADRGANHRQNHPQIVAANMLAGSSHAGVSWTLDSLPTTSYRIELYENGVCGREGRTFAGSAIATTDAAGHAAGTTKVGASPGELFVTATATPFGVRREPLPFRVPDELPPLTVAGSTSEFSPCRQAMVFDPLPAP